MAAIMYFWEKYFLFSTYKDKIKRQDELTNANYMYLGQSFARV